MLSKKNKIFNILYPLITFAVVLLLWQITSWCVNIELLVPSIGVTFSEFFKLVSTKDMYVSVGWTILRSLISFALAFFCAVFLALLARISKKIEKLFNPLLLIMRALPTMSVILIAMIWLTGAQVPILVAFLIIFPTLYSNFLSNLKSVEQDYIEMAKVYKVPKRKTVSMLYIPQMLPRFFDDSKNTISLNLKIVISAEVMAQTRNSIGVNMQFAKIYLETAQLLAWTIVAVVVGALLELLMYSIKRLYLKIKHNKEMF